MKSDEVNGTSEVVPGERFGWHWKTSWRWGCHTGRLGAVRQEFLEPNRFNFSFFFLYLVSLY